MADLIFKNGQDITPKDFQNLSEIQQQQLLFTLIDQKETFEKALQKDLLKALKNAWKNTGAELCQFWQVVEEKKLEKILYDFWLWNVDTGCVFVHHTTEYTQIAMIQYYFDPQITGENDTLEKLAYDLNEAFKRKRKFRLGEDKLQWSDNEEVIDFANAEFIPTDIKQWNHLLTEHKASESFIRTYQAHFNKKSWELISQYSVLSEKCMREFAKHINWKKVCQYQKLSEDFIRTFQNKVDWQWVSFKQILSEDFIIEFAHKVDWDYISCSQLLSEDFIRQYEHRLSWDGISWAQKLSEPFMRECTKKLNWENVLRYQLLSETFLREWLASAEWEHWLQISQVQNLSLAFIQDFEENLNWRALSMNACLTEEIISAFSDKIVWENVAYFNPRAKEILTETRLLELREKYPQKKYWKDIFVHLHHISKQFKADFLKSLND